MGSCKGALSGAVMVNVGLDGMPICSVWIRCSHSCWGLKVVIYFKPQELPLYIQKLLRLVSGFLFIYKVR